MTAGAFLRAIAESLRFSTQFLASTRVLIDFVAVVRTINMVNVLELKGAIRADYFQAAFNPTQIFADDVTTEEGENARLSAFVGAIAVGDLVKSTLGPKGMDKILQSA